MADEQKDLVRLSPDRGVILREAYRAARSATSGRLEPTCLPIQGLLDVVTARRRGLEMALALDFPLPEATKIAVVISELGRNIILYAKKGTITLTAYAEGKKGINVVAEDQGPGIDDVELVLAGGHSTSRGLGLGVSGSRRLMDEFEIQSAVGEGTTIKAAKWLR
jgi:serine/threonine-protein kinase RsbT